MFFWHTLKNKSSTAMHVAELTFFCIEEHTSQLVYHFHSLLTTNVENYTQCKHA